MSPDHIATVLGDSVGELVVACWTDAQSATARITSVDQEGFTCYILDSPDIDPAEEQWIPFDELTHVALK
jgi:hypothetical protein